MYLLLLLGAVLVRFVEEFAAYFATVEMMQAMSGKEADGLLDGDGADDDEMSDTLATNHNDGDNAVGGFGGVFGGGIGGGRDAGKNAVKDDFNLPASMSNAHHFKGIAKNKKTGEVEITVRLPAR